jgi:TonB family protein
MRLILLLVTLLYGAGIAAQQDTIFRYWIDGTYTNIPSKAKTLAKYFLRDGLWYMESRYLSNGGIYMTGSYKESEAKTKHGEFKWYHENGRLSQTATYVDGKREGLVKAWHKNGVLEDSFFYRAERYVNKSRSWNERGILTVAYDLDENGTGRGRTYRDKDSLYSEGGFLNGYRSGTWNYFAPEGYKEWEVEYLKDSVISAKCFDAGGIPSKDCIWEREALPKGGLNGWKKYLVRSLTNAGYPSRKLMKREKNLSGDVWVRFLIEKDGRISDIQIVRSLNAEADAIVLDVMLNAPLWSPGIYRGRVVRSYHTQPISFNVPD